MQGQLLVEVAFVGAMPHECRYLRRPGGCYSGCKVGLRVCHRFAKGKRCNFGVTCKHQHTRIEPSNGHASAFNEPEGVAFKRYLRGRCREGEACRYRHQGPSPNIPPSPTDVTPTNPQQTCIICFVNPIEVIFTCGHACVCKLCAETPALVRCPMCRDPGHKIRMFWPN